MRTIRRLAAALLFTPITTFGYECSGTVAVHNDDIWNGAGSAYTYTSVQFENVRSLTDMEVDFALVNGRMPGTDLREWVRTGVRKTVVTRSNSLWVSMSDPSPAWVEGYYVWLPLAWRADSSDGCDRVSFRLQSARAGWNHFDPGGSVMASWNPRTYVSLTRGETVTVNIRADVAGDPSIEYAARADYEGRVRVHVNQRIRGGEDFAISVTGVSAGVDTVPVVITADSP